jgi:hypothetical protein
MVTFGFTFFLGIFLVFLAYTFAKVFAIFFLIYREAVSSNQIRLYLIFLPGHFLLRSNFFFTNEWGFGKNTIQTSRQLRHSHVFAAVLSAPIYAGIIFFIHVLATEPEFRSFLRGFITGLVLG